jgi:hypothetical protein
VPPLEDQISVRGFGPRATRWRYVLPSELDLMAKLAGLSLWDRWAGWDGAPFTGDSTTHVSIWKKQEP